MKITTKALSLILISSKSLLTDAVPVLFKVLAINGTPSLNINYQQYEMEAVPDNYPLYQKVIDINQFPVNYNYILDYGNGHAEQEEFTRQRSENEESLNEFFGRSITIKKHPLLPNAYPSFEYFKKSRLYDDNFVASIFVKCNEDEIKEMNKNPNNKDLKSKAQVIYASPYVIKTFNNATIHISGQSTREVPKLSYKIKDLKDDNGKELYGRTSIKLRAEHMDPTLLREKLYGDILNTLGVPAAQNTYARLYINQRPIGLFDLSDDVKNNHYLRSTFNNGKKYDEANPNPLYKADCGSGTYSDLSYHGEDPTCKEYHVYSYAGKDKVKTKQEHMKEELIPLLKEIDDYAKGTRNDLSIDVDTFLKYMAMEFLGGAIDNYWNSPGNYFLFKDLTKNKWYFHDIDFHYSFGINWGKDKMLNTPLAEYPPIVDEEKSYRERALLDALRSHIEMETKFKDIFARLLKTSYHPNAIFPRLESITNMIREDAHWDISLEKENPKPSSGESYLYTINDFENDSTSEQAKGFDKGCPIRHFIKNKAILLAKELGVEIPYEYESDLGFFENLTNEKKEKENEESDAMEKRKSWTLFSLFISIIVSLTILL